MIDMERYVGKYFWMLVQSFNPDTYLSSIEHNWRVFTSFFIRTLTLTLTLFIITFIPATIHYIDTLPSTLEEVETLTLSGNISANHSITILPSPSIVLNTNSNLTQSENDVLITREGIVYPSLILFGESYIRWDDVRDLKTSSPERDRALFLAAMFLLPSIIFWFALISILKLLFIFSGLLILGYAVPRFFSHRIRFSETVKIGILASPSIMLIGVGLSPLAPGKLFWWGFGITALLFCLGVFMLSERVSAVHARKV